MGNIARKSRIKSFLPGTLCLLVLGAVFPAHAQDTATLVGTITDQSGASVPEAQVVVTNIATQFTRTVQANGNGQYVASAIPTGSYLITVTKPGFQRLEHTGVQLTAASTL